MRCPWCRTDVRYVRQIAGQHFCSEEHKAAYVARMEESGLRDLTALRTRLRRSLRAPSEPGFCLPKSAVPVRVPKPLKTSRIVPSPAEFVLAAAPPKQQLSPQRLRGLRIAASAQYRPRLPQPDGFQKLAAQVEPFSFSAKLPSERCSQPTHLRHANLIGQICQPLEELRQITRSAVWTVFPETVHTPHSAVPAILTFLPRPAEVPMPRPRPRALPVDQLELQALDVLSWPLFARLPQIPLPGHLATAGFAARKHITARAPEELARECSPLSALNSPVYPRVAPGDLHFPLAAAGPGSTFRLHPFAPPGLTNSFEPEILSPAVFFPVSPSSPSCLGYADLRPEPLALQIPSVRANAVSAEVLANKPAVPGILLQGAPVAAPHSRGLLHRIIDPVPSGRAAVTDAVVPMDSPEEWIGIPNRPVSELNYRPGRAPFLPPAFIEPAPGLQSPQPLPAEWPRESVVHILPLKSKNGGSAIVPGRLERLSFRLKARDFTSPLRGKPMLEVQGSLPLLPTLRLDLPPFSRFQPPTAELPFWNRMPMRAKGLLMAAPLAMVLVTQMISAPGVSPYNSYQGTPIGRAWKGMVNSLSSRAAIDVDEDFRAGLADWAGSSGNAAGWRFDGGSLIPASFGIYRPSALLRDYHVEFSGQIRKKALGWAVRAADPDNYYGIKLVALPAGAENGPMQKVVLQRFPVIGGVRGQKTEIPLHIAASPDTIYHVALDVFGDRASLSVQGQVVDSWEFASHRTGGIGFFSEKTELASVQGLRITHQTDTLGKLCAWLVR